LTNRAHETVTKISTPFKSVFVHVSWDKDKPIGISLSHQQKDMESDVARMLNSLSSGLNKALKAGMLDEIVGGLYDAIKAGP